MVKSNVRAPSFSAVLFELEERNASESVLTVFFFFLEYFSHIIIWNERDYRHVMLSSLSPETGPGERDIKHAIATAET